MKQKLFLTTALLSCFTVISCGKSSNYVKVLNVTYKNNSGTTIGSFASDLNKERIKIASYKFSSDSIFSDAINGFNDTWYVAFSYKYDIIKHESVNESFVPDSIKIVLNTSFTESGTTYMILQNKFGEYESYKEAFIDPNNLRSKEIQHVNKTYKAKSKNELKGKNVYQAQHSMPLEEYSLTFTRFGEYDKFSISSYGSEFAQQTKESYFAMPDKSDNISVSFSYFPKA